MATYILLGNFTDQGIRNVKDTTKRVESVRALVQKHGATVKDAYWTMGKFDVVLILDAPDEAAVTAIGLSIGALGNARTQTLRAFTAAEIGPILSRLG
jgi:uncharacterized protein with GYD domain